MIGLAASHHRQRVGGAPGVVLGVARLRSRDDRAVPIVDDVARLVVFEALDLHQPVDMIAVGVAAEAIIVVGIDPHARFCFAVERAQDHAVARHRAVDQVGEIDLGVVERRLPFILRPARVAATGWRSRAWVELRVEESQARAWVESRARADAGG